MNNSFYDDTKTYDIPSTSNYMKFEEGENKFRIMGSFRNQTAIQGLEYWKTENGKRKPVRLARKEDGTFPSVPVNELEINSYGEPDRPRFFWAFPVYNYADNRIQILEISQKTILKSIQAYIQNPKWGDPREYDIIVTRGKEGDKVTYTVTVDPKEKLSKPIVAQYETTFINMQALFTGDDPFMMDEILQNDALPIKE